QCNVGEVAAAIGYKSIAAFTRAFQAEFGRSPNSVRGRDIRPTV
ncbi:MAG: AraC family transcriptional regulator, partial [Spirochaetaceae bacterium]